MEQKLDNLEFGGLVLFALFDFGFDMWLAIIVKVLAGAGLIYKIIDLYRRNRRDKVKHTLELQQTTEKHASETQRAVEKHASETQRAAEKHALEMALLRKQLGGGDRRQNYSRGLVSPY